MVMKMSGPRNATSASTISDVTVSGEACPLAQAARRPRRVAGAGGGKGSASGTVVSNVVIAEGREADYGEMSQERTSDDVGRHRSFGNARGSHPVPRRAAPTRPSRRRR